MINKEWYLLDENGLVLDLVQTQGSVFLTPCPDVKTYYWNGEEWLISSEKLVEIIELQIDEELDSLELKLAKNETYYGTENYDTYKDEILENITELRTQRTSLSDLTLKELQEILADD